jgi:hypothetical protein
MNKRLEEDLKRNPRLRELWDNMPPFKPKPKTKLVTELDGKIAAVAQTRPESVSVRVTASDGNVVHVDHIRQPTVEVVEVDANGMPKLTKKWNATTNAWDWIEHKAGYSMPSEAVLKERGGGVGAVHAYNPLDALKD